MSLIFILENYILALTDFCIPSRHSCEPMVSGSSKKQWVAPGNLSLLRPLEPMLTSGSCQAVAESAGVQNDKLSKIFGLKQVYNIFILFILLCSFSNSSYSKESGSNITVALKNKREIKGELIKVFKDSIIVKTKLVKRSVATKKRRSPFRTIPTRKIYSILIHGYLNGVEPEIIGILSAGATTAIIASASKESDNNVLVGGVIGGIAGGLIYWLFESRIAVDDVLYYGIDKESGRLKIHSKVYRELKVR